MAKLMERGGAIAAISRALDHMHLTVIEFDRAQAGEGGALRQASRSETAPAWRLQNRAASLP